MFRKQFNEVFDVIYVNYIFIYMYTQLSMHIYVMC